MKGGWRHDGVAVVALHMESVRQWWASWLLDQMNANLNLSLVLVINVNLWMRVYVAKSVQMTFSVTPFAFRDKYLFEGHYDHDAEQLRLEVAFLCKVFHRYRFRDLAVGLAAFLRPFLILVL